MDRLGDSNHPIITLHGRGGIGKTSLALFITRQLADRTPPAFDLILWLSARDLELRPSGPSQVRRAVPNLDSVCRLIAEFFAVDPTLETLASILRDPSAIGSEGMLLVFDNFETLDDPRGVHRFLDMHTHIPNKILITSRQRAFKGDWPIEVGGMEFDEARELLRRLAASLQVERIVTESVIGEIFEYTDGHAYVMRVLVGEVARDRRWVPLKSLVPRRGDLLGAVFERSFNRLSTDGKWIFLTIAGWRSAVPEIALLVVTGQRGVDVEGGIDECLRLSLIDRHELADGQYCYATPELARLFAKKKLEGDPDRLVIEEDLHLLREFGVIKVGEACTRSGDVLIERFLQGCLSSAPGSSSDQLGKMDSIMVKVAEAWPKGWPIVAEFRKVAGLAEDEVSYALRRAVEELPQDKSAWLARAEHAQTQGDEGTRIASLVSAVEAAPRDAALIRDVALQLCQYVDAHKAEIPQARRGVYVASVRSHMEKIATELDATGLSRLAWLFLLEGNTDGAWKYANMGIERESTNRHCLNIVERLDEQGYTP